VKISFVGLLILAFIINQVDQLVLNAHVLDTCDVEMLGTM